MPRDPDPRAPIPLGAITHRRDGSAAAVADAAELVRHAAAVRVLVEWVREMGGAVPRRVAEAAEQVAPALGLARKGG